MGTLLTPADDTALGALEQLSTAAGALSLAAEVRALSVRVRNGLFYVACIGQFKRGKSTLLNALVGKPVLPTGVAPVTSVLTVLRYGAQLGARVQYAADAWQAIAPGDLAQYVSEEHNPENRRGVVAVEVFVPSALLASGMCLVDTPGIGSVFEGNTEATRAFVPHIDAALVVLGAEPPISAEELALVGAVARQGAEMLFVLNKADRLTDTDWETAARFTRRVLAERAGLDGARLFDVSAANRLAGVGPERDWPGLIETLESLGRESKDHLVQAAEERGLTLLADRLRHHLDEDRGALLRPVEDSARRVETLRGCVREAERALGDLAHLLLAEEERLGRTFEDRRLEFLSRAVPTARRELFEAVRTLRARRGPALRREAIALADAVAKNWLEHWRTEAEPAAEALYVEAMRRFSDLANGVLEQLASAEPALAALPRAVTPETGFSYRSRLYYTSLLTRAAQTPVGWFLDVIRSRRQQLEALDRQLGAYLETLVSTNSSRIVRDVEDRVLESGRRLQARIRSALAGVASSAEEALGRAKEWRARGSRAVEHQVDLINMLGARLDALGLARKDVSE